MAIRAIETVWNGYRFRSRLEARYAVFLDALGLAFDYELEGFELDDGTRYLPDFYLPEAEGGLGGIWLEIKPTFPTSAEETKATLLARNGTPVVIASGVPQVPKRLGIANLIAFRSHSNILAYWCECSRCGAIGIMAIEGEPWICCCWMSPPKVDMLLGSPRIKRAIEKAIQARFEFGQTPLTGGA